eukprot:1239382-Rhodomonas_salina.2
MHNFNPRCAQLSALGPPTLQSGHNGAGEGGARDDGEPPVAALAHACANAGLQPGCAPPSTSLHVRVRISEWYSLAYWEESEWY